MADIVLLTEEPVSHTAAGKQALRNAVDVSAYDELDLLLTVYRVGGGASTIQVAILTAMQKESEDGWVTAATFGSTGATEASLLHVAGPLCYLRYELLTAATTSFLVQGVGRRWA